MILKRKTSDLELKDFDQKKGLVSFYFAHFGSRDSDGDIITPGAYKKTFDENRRRIKHFKNHDMTQVPGVVIELHEDSSGAYAVSQLAMTTLGRDTLIEYESGIITEHSQGFNILQEQFDEMEGVNIIKEIRLWEVSSLTAWGANMNTPVIDVKNADNAIDLLKKLNNILTRTAISDERAITLEKEYKKLSKIVSSLSITTEPSTDTPSDEKPNEIEKDSFNLDLTKYLNNLK